MFACSEKEKKENGMLDLRSQKAVLLVSCVALGIAWLERRAPLAAADVTEKELTFTCSANGVIEAPLQAKVAPVVSGEIVELKLVEGDTVKAGDIIVRLDSAALDAERDAIQATIRTAEAGLARMRGGARPQETAEAQAEVEKARAHLDERRQDLDRYQKLFDRQAASLKELQTIQAQFKMAGYDVERVQQRQRLLEEGARSDDVEISRRKLDEARSQLKVLQTRREKTLIKAPMAGTVVKKLAYQGEIALPGRPLVHLVSLEHLDAVFNVEETYIDGIEVGDSAEITVDAMPGKTFAGKVLFISPVSSEQLKVSLLKEEDDTKRFHVKIRVDPGQARLINEAITRSPAILEIQHHCDDIGMLSTGLTEEQRRALMTRSYYKSLCTLANHHGVLARPTLPYASGE
jgi:HlyD family secretion protein